MFVDVGFGGDGTMCRGNVVYTLEMSVWPLASQVPAEVSDLQIDKESMCKH